MYLIPEKSAKIFFLFAAAILLLNVIMLPLPREDKHIFSTDAIYYYTYLRSLAFDHDLHLENEIEIINKTSGTLYHWMGQETQSKMFSIGPALLWLPFWIPARGITLIAHEINPSVPLHGYSMIEEGILSLASVFYMLLGLYLILRLLWKYTDNEKRITWGVILFFTSSSGIFYILFEPTMSHSMEFFTVSLYLFSLLTFNLRSRKNLILIGIISGLMALVRWQNVLLGIILLVRMYDIVWRDNFSIRSFFGSIAFLLAGAFPFFVIQLIFWRLLAGAWFTSPVPSSFLHFTNPKVLQVLFSPRHGLFLWTPAVMAGVAGFFFMKERLMGRTYIAAFLLLLYLFGIVDDWWAGGSFGMRRYVGFLPVLIIGFIYGIIVRTKSRLPFVLLGIFSLWNVLFMLQFKLNMISPTSSLTLKELTIDKFLVPYKLILYFWDKVF